MFMIIGILIGGIAAALAYCLRQKRMKLNRRNDRSAEMKNKDHDHIVINDVCVERQGENGTESKCNSPEWERGPEHQ